MLLPGKCNALRQLWIIEQLIYCLRYRLRIVGDEYMTAILQSERLSRIAPRNDWHSGGYALEDLVLRPSSNRDVTKGDGCLRQLRTELGKKPGDADPPTGGQAPARTIRRCAPACNLRAGEEAGPWGAWGRPAGGSSAASRAPAARATACWIAGLANVSA